MTKRLCKQTTYRAFMLNFVDDKAALIAFLQAITGKPYKMPRPDELPH